MTGTGNRPITGNTRTKSKKQEIKDMFPNVSHFTFNFNWEVQKWAVLLASRHLLDTTCAAEKWFRYFMSCLYQLGEDRIMVQLKTRNLHEIFMEFSKLTPEEKNEIAGERYAEYRQLFREYSERNNNRRMAAAGRSGEQQATQEEEEEVILPSPAEELIS